MTTQRCVIVRSGFDGKIDLLAAEPLESSIVVHFHIHQCREGVEVRARYCPMEEACAMQQAAAKAVSTTSSSQIHLR